MLRYFSCNFASAVSPEDQQLGQAIGMKTPHQPQCGPHTPVLWTNTNVDLRTQQVKKPHLIKDAYPHQVVQIKACEAPSESIISLCECLTQQVQGCLEDTDMTLDPKQHNLLDILHALELCFHLWNCHAQTQVTTAEALISSQTSCIQKPLPLKNGTAASNSIPGSRSDLSNHQLVLAPVR